MAGDKAAYPREKVAEFIVEKLDITSLPAAIRPKKEKGKRTFADYGFAAQRVDENEAVIEAAGGVKRLAIKVLDQKSSGIYVCVAEPGENGGQAKTQSVLLAEKERSACIAKGTRILSRICCMPGDWRKRLYGEFVWGLRSYLETRCSDRVCGFGRCRPGDRGTCSWATPMCGLSTSLPIARMNSAHSATRDSYLIMNGTQSVLCVETTC